MGRYQVSPDRFGTLNIHDYWHLDRITKQDRQYLNREFSTTVDGDTVDIYVIDTGVRGASRPTGNNAALHPELFDPNFVSDLNGTSEQQNYRVFEVAGYTSPYSTNEDDNGHGTYCAICSAGRTAGVAREAKIYALKAFAQVSALPTPLSWTPIRRSLTTIQAAMQTTKAITEQQLSMLPLDQQFLLKTILT